MWLGVGAVLGATLTTSVLALLGPRLFAPRVVVESAGAPEPSVPMPAVVEVTEPPTAATALRAARRPLPLYLDDADRRSLRGALTRSRRWLASRPVNERWTYGPRSVRNSDLIRAMDRLRRWLDEEDLPGEELAARIATEWEPLESVGGPEGGMLFTGYYEPVIPASRRPSSEFAVPVLRPPPEMVRVDLGAFRDDWSGESIVGRVSGRRFEPMPERGEIRETRLWRDRALAWARDPVDLFFLEVQGSGTLAFPDGSELRIGYSSSNGRPYRSIGKLLIDEGHVEREAMSMQAIRDWLARHPDELHRVLDHNASVVFFRELDGAPEGNLGFPVTPARTIATDRRIFPPAALGWVEIEMPEDLVPGGHIRRFVLNQDTGGAIRGPGRVDLFCGRGPEAAEMAGRMKQPGRLFLLVPRDDSV